MSKSKLLKSDSCLFQAIASNIELASEEQVHQKFLANLTQAQRLLNEALANLYVLDFLERLCAAHKTQSCEAIRLTEFINHEILAVEYSEVKANHTYLCYIQVLKNMQASIFSRMAERESQNFKWNLSPQIIQLRSDFGIAKDDTTDNCINNYLAMGNAVLATKREYKTFYQQYEGKSPNLQTMAEIRSQHMANLRTQYEQSFVPKKLPSERTSIQAKPILTHVRKLINAIKALFESFNAYVIPKPNPTENTKALTLNP